MPNEILSNVAATITTINKDISDTQELISFLSDAGETTAELDQKLKSLILRKNKYEQALKTRGIKVE